MRLVLEGPRLATDTLAGSGRTAFTDITRVQELVDETMRLYRVHLCNERCADVIIQAENSTEAESLALKESGVEWSDHETTVTDVSEIDGARQTKCFSAKDAAPAELVDSRGLQGYSKPTMIRVGRNKLTTSQMKKNKKGVCRCCGCTEDHSDACGGCAWVDEKKRDLCTACINWPFGDRIN